MGRKILTEIKYTASKLAGVKHHYVQWDIASPMSTTEMSTCDILGCERDAYRYNSTERIDRNSNAVNKDARVTLERNGTYTGLPKCERDSKQPIPGAVFEAAPWLGPSLYTPHTAWRPRTPHPGPATLCAVAQDLPSRKSQSPPQFFAELWRRCYLLPFSVSPLR